MLIVNDDHRRRTGVCGLDELCPYCGSAFAFYPLIMSDDPGQTVYHVACALELATDLLVDLYTFFSPPTPYARLFTATFLEHWPPRPIFAILLLQGPTPHEVWRLGPEAQLDPFNMLITCQ